ncbi:hypothetical protein Lbys_0865 [Leadbetterella byssophila DSM 17132]|uniref:Uncharacterized protein n=2 Tax=Leadbetterella TaxID=319458 RepID=E4RR16_LEAB4|nr:hypothetical protein Lbys_0865 [Leadbetterella byssophila DSM 17132]
MALTVLVSSHSFAYYEHLCTITQIKKVSFEPESCYGKLSVSEVHEVPSFKKGTCCEISFKVNKGHTAIQSSFNLMPFVAVEMQLPEFQFLCPTLIPEKSEVLASSNSSPPSSVPLFIKYRKLIL